MKPSDLITWKTDFERIDDSVPPQFVSKRLKAYVGRAYIGFIDYIHTSYPGREHYCHFMKGIFSSTKVHNSDIQTIDGLKNEFCRRHDAFVQILTGETQ